ncbi:MAG: autoinducer binding domain-containing protein [Roseiarcus sp.]|jgi:LuxR family quorum sensing-dependent transcriptional regulator
MDSRSRRDKIFDAIDEISRLTSSPQIAATLGRTIAEYGYAYFGINGLPPPGETSDPVVLAEVAPEGFRDCYIEERFYRVDHICAHARTAYEPFRFSEAPYAQKNARSHQRFMQALVTYGLGRGLIVPIGRPDNIPACMWCACANPDLHDAANRAIQLIALFAASKAYALYRPPHAGRPASALTPAEREALQWISAGKTSWEIAAISGRSERTINKIIADAMAKLDAVTRTQAVANAIRVGEIEL